MKKIITAVMILVVALVVLTGCKKNATVYYLNFKPEADTAWQALAKEYEKQTGIKVNVVTAAEGKYEETLTSEMNKSSAPTLFQISGLVGYDVWKEYCLDLKDTNIYKQFFRFQEIYFHLFQNLRRLFLKYSLIKCSVLTLCINDFVFLNN